MDQESDRRRHDLAEAPSAIRAAMAETRKDLSRHLRALKEQLLRPLPLATPVKEPSMQVQKKSHPAEAPGDHKTSKRKSSLSAKSAKPDSPSKEPAAKSARSKASASSSSSSKSGGTKARKSGDARKKTTTRKAKSTGHSLVEKTGEVLDTVVAGAVVGAVTGAARNVAHETAAMPLTNEAVSGVPTSASSETPSTREVLSEMAGGAALGAVAGAAKAVMPTETEHAKTKKRGKH
jgi:hypothetical protein